MTSEREDLAADEAVPIGVSPQTSNLNEADEEPAAAGAPLEVAECDDDPELQAFEAEQAAAHEKRLRRQRPLRLAGLWWEMASYRIGSMFRRFPGWTAAAFAGGIAVVLSLMLLLIHFIWSSGAADDVEAIAGSDDAAETATLGEPADDGEFFPEFAGDDEGPFAAEPPFQKTEPADDMFDESGTFEFQSRADVEPIVDTDNPFVAAPASELEIDLTAHAVAGMPDDGERLLVRSEEYELPAGIVPFSRDELAAVDPLWQPFNELRGSGDEPNWLSGGDDVISASKNTDAADDELWKDAGTRSRLNSSDEADADRPSVHEMRLAVAPVDGVPGELSPLSGWVIRNEGRSSIEALSVENVVPDGLRLLRGEWRDNGFVPSDWRFRELDADATKRVGFAISPERADENDGFANVETTMRVHVGGAVSAATRVDAPHLKLTWSQPQEITPGQLFVIDFAVENTGVIPVEGTRIEADLGDGLVHRFGNRIVYKVGRLDAGQTFKFQMFLTAPKAGEFEQEVRLTAGETVFQREQMSFEVGEGL